MRDWLVRFDKVGFVFALFDSLEILAVQADDEQNGKYIKWNAQELIIYHLAMLGPLIDIDQEGIIKHTKQKAQPKYQKNGNQNAYIFLENSIALTSAHNSSLRHKALSKNSNY